jgi:hypothetical protein
MSEPNDPLTKIGTKAVEKTIEELASGVRDAAKAIGAEAAVETGGILGDQFRYWRWCNRVRLIDKMAAKLRSRGVDPKKVLPSEWVPLLEAGSLTDDENLKEMWATLLANAADPTKRVTSTAAYITVLRQLSSVEVHYLSLLTEHQRTLTDLQKKDPAPVLPTPANTVPVMPPEYTDWLRRQTMREPALLDELFQKMIDAYGLTPPDFTEMFENLMRLGLIHDRAKLTEFGRLFLRACTT